VAAVGRRDEGGAWGWEYGGRLAAAGDGGQTAGGARLLGTEDGGRCAMPTDGGLGQGVWTAVGSWDGSTGALSRRGGCGPWGHLIKWAAGDSGPEDESLPAPPL
jgi:hypothetical protein